MSVASGGAPFVTMVQTAHLRDRDHSPEFRRLHFPWLWRVLLQRQMRPGLVIIGKIRGQSAPQTGFVEYDHMIQAFPPNGADQPLDISPLPRRAGSCQHLLNPHVPDLAAEVFAKDFVAVSQQTPRGLLPLT